MSDTLESRSNRATMVGSRTVPSIWGISAEELSKWARKYEAASVLPELVRRLLLATAYVEQVEMRSGAGVRLPGYDGVVIARMTSPFCPAGPSVWELSTEDKPEKKATKDILKREEKPLNISPRETTYVVVTARRFSRKEPWIAEQVRRGSWRGVKVIDADDLAMWLAQCPAVAVWFASEHLGRPVSRWYDLRAWRRRWQLRTTPPLPGELVLIDREQQQTELRRWLEQLDEHPTALIRIAAENRDEACLFLAEVVLAASSDRSRPHRPESDPDPNPDPDPTPGLRDSPPSMRSARLESRVLVVESKESWRTATELDTSEPLVLVPMFSDFDPGELSSRHAIVVPAEATTRDHDVLRINEPLPWRSFFPWLSKLFASEEEAQRRARDSGGKLSALQSSLGYSATPWVDQAPREDLIAFMLMGAWEPASAADAECAVSLGTSAEKLEAICVGLATADEAPSTKHGAGWRWVSHASAWQTLAKKLTDRDLKRFCEVAQRVLGVDDPRYKLPKDERWCAITRGIGLRHSELLREGIAESLVRLSLADDQLASAHGSASKGSATTDWIVCEILQPSWIRWASLSEFLPVLAEASPKQFMRALEESLDQDDGAAKLLMQEPENGMGEAPHTGLLWALETLGWRPKYMPRVASALARLAESDPGGNLANRPFASLTALADLAFPQTLSGDSDRHSTLESILENYPDVGWKLLLKLLPSTSPRLIHGSARPTFRSWGVPTKPQTPDSETWSERINNALTLALGAANTNPERWCLLIEAHLDEDLPVEQGGRLLPALLKQKGNIDDPHASIWNALRQRLDLYYSIERESERDGKALARIKRVYKRFTPDDPIVRALPLFRFGLVLPEPHVPFSREKEERIQTLQAEFLRELAVRGDHLEPIERMLAMLGPDLGSIAAALATSPMAEEVEKKLLSHIPQPPWDGLLPGFAERRRHTQGFEWFAKTLRLLVKEGRSDEAVRAALGSWSEPEIWQLIDELGEPVFTEYWRRISRIGEHQGPPRYHEALAHLITAKNVPVAVQLASWQVKEIPTELALSTLELVIESLPDPDNRSLATKGRRIDKIFNELEGRDDVNVERAASLESVLSTNVGSRGRTPYFLNRVIGNSPVEFARMIAKLYRAASEDKGASASASAEDEDEDEAKAQAQAQAQAQVQAQAQATWAYRILESWGYPGRDISDAEERERIVFDWAKDALKLTRDADRQAVGELEVAKVLARVPAAEDERWPCIAARRLLESGRHPDLMRGMRTARRNQRGLRLRAVDDGQEEAAIAEDYSQAALALGTRWPRTAALLDDLADSFRHGAEYTAKWTREQRHLEGTSRSPTPLPLPQDSPSSAAMSSTDLFSLPGLRCTAVGPAPSLSIDLSQRLNLFTGDNGLGKTFLLDTAWWVLTGSWPGTQAQPLRGSRSATERAAIELVPTEEGTPLPLAHFDARHDRWSRPLEWPVPDGLMIYVRVDGGFSIWDSQRMNLGDADPLASALHLTQRDLWDRYERDGVVLCNGLPTDWLQWQSRHPETFERFFGIVRALFEGDIKVEPGVAIPLGIRDDREIPTIRLPRGDIPIHLLSAGMKRILGLAYVITWAYERHVRALRLESIDASPKSVIFLIDEVECHLHPKWQRALLPALLAQLEALEGEPAIQILATTHAPFVTASCETIFDPERDGLFVFDTDDNHQVILNQIDWAKHGNIANWVTSDVFGLDRSRSLEAERAINAAFAFMRGEATDRSRDEIDASLREVLAGDDEFWPHWIVSARDGTNQ